MKIEQSAVAMQADHRFSSEYEARLESVTSFRSVFEGVAQAGELPANGEMVFRTDRKTDREARLLMLLEAFIVRLLELITGKQDSSVTDLRAPLKTQMPENSTSRPARALEMEWKNEFTEIFREHERTDFSSTGKILAADGRSLDFKLELAMCRDFECESKIIDSGKAVVLRDPLVINFDGKAAELSGKRFAFDLDADGKSELIGALGASSGFLAIDRNADGHINDGSELFGTRSGNGFADLAAFDGDGNHWLDEADAAFTTLRIWQRDGAGQDTLSTLRDKGVGALYLGSTETPFALNDSENRPLAQIRASGIYLREDGSAGTLQQVDLAV
ncbi:MAG: hypothetical protein IPP85_02635 [Propionivibrio sp.]|nr:hypothetical protein [Propionivibrio sp.]